MIVHLNGKLVPREEALVSVFDRGFVFGDGIYEGLRALAWPRGESGAGTRVVGVQRHIERMRGALEGVGIAWDPGELHRMSVELLRANGLVDAFVYWQVTRGTPGAGAPARSRVPSKGMAPTVFGYCTPQPSLEVYEDGRVPTKTAVTIEDQRWLLGRIKSTSLMGNVLASMAADAAEGEDAVFMRDGLVTEGLATNVIVVDGGGRIVTPPLEAVPILAGVTRAILLKEAPEIEERAVLASELGTAQEVMLTGTTTMVTSVVKLDGRAIGEGRAGPVARRLLGLLLKAIREGREDLGA